MFIPVHSGSHASQY